MTKPHKHADVIKAWADGAEIEAFDSITESWYVVNSPQWAAHGQYRAKPKPAKWQTEMDAHTRGEDIEARLCGSDDWRPCRIPAWYSDGSCEYRIKPKTVKTRTRVAAMGEPNGEGRIWVRSAHTDEHAAQTERNEHFLRWLGGWHEVERPEPPADGILSAGRITAAKISDGTIDYGNSPLGELHAMGFDAAKPGSDRTVAWCSSGEWPPSGGFSWGIR